MRASPAAIRGAAFAGNTKVLKKRHVLSLIAAAAAAPLLVLQHPVLAGTSGGALPPVMGFDAGAASPLRVLEDARKPMEAHQVRIERRVIIRISPSNTATREQMMASLPRRELRTTYQEVDHGNCVPIEAIAGVQPTRDNRLLLFMRDRQVLAATLRRGCTAREYYSGFYVENSEDGKLCVARDRLQSRAGASCEVAGFNRLVAVRD